jgi:hypothetical protein
VPRTDPSSLLLHLNVRQPNFTWENYDGSEIRVEKSVWRSHADEPKRPKSKGAIPVIAQLKLLLDQHWERCGRPRKRFIFANERGRPMNFGMARP